MLLLSYLIITVSALSPPSSPINDVCDYQCTDGHGCKVNYVGPPRGGRTSGSCFPRSFGGKCSGTPPECLPCNQAIDCSPQQPTGPTTHRDKLCSYSCSNSGGCSTRYVGPARRGRVSGSCFSALFGGSCLGTPPECRHCNQVLQCPNNDEGLSSGGHSTVPREIPREPKSLPGSNKRDVCEYKCTEDGSCISNYLGPLREGSMTGSCLSNDGPCCGTPPECQDCNKAIQCKSFKQSWSDGPCQYTRDTVYDPTCKVFITESAVC